VSFKLLIDECLSPTLVQLAHDAGFHESICVRDRGWSGVKDHQLMEYATDGDFTLVTHNARDFRGDQIGSSSGLYGKSDLHAGLICLTDASMSFARQRELFQAALDELALLPDLVNKCMEVVGLESGEIEINLFEVPKH
jgi:predicted nuclease of predicted toxin-antitoxin system